MTQFYNERLAIIGIASVFLLAFLLLRHGPAVSNEFLIERAFDLNEIRAYKKAQHARSFTGAYEVSRPAYPNVNIRASADVFKALKRVVRNDMPPYIERKPETIEKTDVIDNMNIASTRKPAMNGFKGR